jgi:hypothetical protein
MATVLDVDGRLDPDPPQAAQQIRTIANLE